MSRGTSLLILTATALGLAPGYGSTEPPEVADSGDSAPGQPGDPPKPAVPAPVLVQGPARAGRRNSDAPGSPGAMAGKTVPALAAALKDADGWVRRFACWELGKRGAAAKEALPALRESLKSPTARDRFDAAEAILLIDPSEAEPVEVLIELLKHDDAFRVRPWYAASALAIVPAQAETALPVLIQSLDAPHPSARLMAITGIGRLGPKNGAPAVEKLRDVALHDTDEPTRLKAAETLDRLLGKPTGPSAKPPTSR